MVGGGWWVSGGEWGCWVVNRKVAGTRVGSKEPAASTGWEMRVGENCVWVACSMHATSTCTACDRFENLYLIKQRELFFVDGEVGFRLARDGLEGLGSGRVGAVR